jgi:hypothetical protein
VCCNHDDATRRRFHLYFNKGVINMSNERINLKDNSLQGESLVKSGAFAIFKTMRIACEYASHLPEVASQALDDVKDAWEESKRPNA